MAVQAQFFAENLCLPMCGLQDWTVNPVFGSDGDALFSPQQPQLTHFYQHQSSQTLGGVDCSDQGASLSSSCDSFLPMAFSQSLETQLEKQRQEIDCFLQLQSGRLMFALQEQRKQQLAVILNGWESKALFLMRQKEEDLAQATMKTKELEQCLKKAEMESESWQRLAKANEATVIGLNNTLEQVRERLVLVSNRAEDAESFCGSCDQERANGEQEVVKQHCKTIACKSCNSRNSCVLFLPCRHLCSCKYCEPFLGSCPVCKSVKEASMEVFLV